MLRIRNMLRLIPLKHEPVRYNFIKQIKLLIDPSSFHFIGIDIVYMFSFDARQLEGL